MHKESASTRPRRSSGQSVFPICPPCTDATSRLPLSSLAAREYHSAIMRQAVRDARETRADKGKIAYLNIDRLQYDERINEDEASLLRRVADVCLGTKAYTRESLDEIRDIYHRLVDRSANNMAIAVTGVALSSAEFSSDHGVSGGPILSSDFLGAIAGGVASGHWAGALAGGATASYLASVPDPGTNGDGTGGTGGDDDDGTTGGD